MPVSLDIAPFGNLSRHRDGIPPLMPSPVSKTGEAAGEQPRVLAGRCRILAIVVVVQILPAFELLYPSDIRTAQIKASELT
jgi:hypothetical protein